MILLELRQICKTLELKSDNILKLITTGFIILEFPTKQYANKIANRAKKYKIKTTVVHDVGTNWRSESYKVYLEL